MTRNRLLLVCAALLAGCSDTTGKEADSGVSPDSMAATAWPAIQSVTNITLPEGTRAAAFVVW